MGLRRIKWGTAAVLAVAAVCVLGGCSGSAPAYRDGTYTAEAAGYDDSGWKDVVTVTVTGGKITGADWNAVNEDGGEDKKSLSRSGQYGMTAGGAKSEWHEQAASIETALVNEQDPAKIKLRGDGKTDAVSGVTMSVEPFVRLAGEALANAKE